MNTASPVLLAHNVSKRVQGPEGGLDLLQDITLEVNAGDSLAITGPSGSGKSTLIESMGQYWVDRGKSVAVLAIDPSSNVTGGSILGDKTRMEQLAHHPKAFIRPSASGDECRSRGHVKLVGATTTGSAGVGQMRVICKLHLRSQFAHYCCAT